MFCNVTKLELEYNFHRPKSWTSFFSERFYISIVIKIILTGLITTLVDQGIITNLRNLLQQACSLTALDICCQYEQRNSNLTAQDICSITPPQLKHLATAIKNLNETRIVLEQLQHLSTARFFYASNNSSSDAFIEWLEKNKIGSSHFVGAVQTKIWFGHDPIRPNKVIVGNKKIKLIDEHHHS